MASLDPYDDDGYSDDEEEEDWPDTDIIGGAMANLNKDHRVKSSQMSEVVSVREFKNLCTESIQSVADGTYDQVKSSETRLSTACELGLTVPELAKLKDELDPKKLLPPNGFPELRRLDLSKVSKESCFKSLKVHGHLRDRFRKSPVTYGYNLIGGEPAKACLTKVPPGEVVLSVAVFYPINKQRDQEFVVLGSQKLTELRDKIVCHNDFFIKKDYSEKPSSYREQIDTLPNPPNVSPSALFFINNTLYDDRRHSDSVDLSKPIMEWASVKERQQLSRRVEQFTTANMADTTFEQLSLRLGYPYLFTHHTDCEHLIKFTDMRMFHRGVDPPSLIEYPRLSYRHKRQAIKCRMCRAIQPQWVTFNDDLATCSPCHFCEDCFTKLHYSKDGKKIAKFEAYPFHPTSH